MSQTSRVGVDMLQHMFPQFVYKLLCLLCCLLRRILRLVTTLLLHWAGICYYDLYQYGCSKCTNIFKAKAHNLCLDIALMSTGALNPLNLRQFV